MPYMAQQPGRRRRSRAIDDPRHDALEVLEVLAAVTRIIDADLPTSSLFADSPWVRTVAPKPEYL